MNPGFSVQELPYMADSRAAFARLQALEGSFLMYSASGFDREHFDIFSALPSDYRAIGSGDLVNGQLQMQIQSMIRTLEDNACSGNRNPMPGWYGLLSYDLFRVLHNLQRRPEASLPVFVAGFYPVVIVNDHLEKRTEMIILNGHEATAQTLLKQLRIPHACQAFHLIEDFQSNLNHDQYRECFERIQRYLHAGDCYQVNLAQRFSARFEGSVWEAYMRLSSALPAPMSAFFNGPGFSCLSLSPERFLSIRQSHVTTYPIKGTRARSDNPETDLQQALELQASPKDRAENLMIVDLLRNDLGLSCVPGSIRVPKLFAVESYANVHHLVSTIEGRLRPDIHPLQALINAFPGGSITGAPKRRAMEIIDELEPDNRSFYCGSAFYCDISGRLDSSILIRSLVSENGELHCWGGGGIVADSTCEQEYQETLDKVGLLLKTLENS